MPNTADLDTLLHAWAACWSVDKGAPRKGISLYKPSIPVAYEYIDYTGKKLEGRKDITHLSAETHRLTITPAPVHYTHEETSATTATQQCDSQGKTVGPETATITVSIPKIYQSKVRCSLTRTLKFSAQATLGISAPKLHGLTAQAQTGLGYTRTRTRLSESEEKEIIKNTFEQVVPCQKHCSNIVEIIRTDSVVTRPYTQSVKLTGFVLIKCSKAVSHTQVASLKETVTEDTRWAIPITDVFKDLKIYRDASPSRLSPKVIEILEAFTVEETQVLFTQQGVETIDRVTHAVKHKTAPIKDVAQQPETIRQALIAHHKAAEHAIERLYPQPLSVKTDYIHLAMVGQATFRQQVTQAQTADSPAVDIESKQELLCTLLADGSHTESIDKILPRPPESGKSNPPHKVLITGSAGIGKTTLSQYLPHLWAERKWGKQYPWVFRLALRELTDARFPATTQDGTPLAWTSVSLIRALCLDPMVKANPEAGELGPLTGEETVLFDFTLDRALKAGEVLLILDGYDEVVGCLPSHLETLLKSLFAQPQVILTSRPYNLYGLDKQGFGFSANARFEVTGFTDTDIHDYIQRFFQTLIPSAPDKAALLEQFLAANPTLASSCHIPINLELVCTTWEQGLITEHNFSMSRLYHQVTIALCARYLQRQPGSGVDAKKVQELSASVCLESCKTPLTLLAHLGFTSLTEHKIFVSLDTTMRYLKTCLPTDAAWADVVHGHTTQQKRFGFIKPIQAQGALAGNAPYYFSHLTFRDTFAALYLADCLQREVWQAESKKNAMPPGFEWASPQPHAWWPPQTGQSVMGYLTEHLFDDSLEVVLWFLVGHLARVNDTRTLTVFFEGLLQAPDILGLHTALLLVRCVDELQDSFYKLPHALQTTLVNQLTEWLLIALSPEHPLGYTDPAAKKLMARYRLSPWLAGQSQLIDLLKAKLSTASPGFLYRLICWLATINDPEHLLMDPVMRALGDARYNDYLSKLKQSYDRLGEWACEKSALVDIWKEVLQSSEAEDQSKKIAVIHALTFKFISKIENEVGEANKWLGELVEIVNKAIAAIHAENGGQTIAAIHAGTRLLKAIRYNGKTKDLSEEEEKWKICLKEIQKLTFESEIVLTLQRTCVHAVARLADRKVGEEYGDGFVQKYLYCDFARENKRQQITAIKSIAFAGACGGGELMEPLLEIIRQPFSEENKGRQTAAAYAIAIASASKLAFASSGCISSSDTSLSGCISKLEMSLREKEVKDVESWIGELMKFAEAQQCGSVATSAIAVASVIASAKIVENSRSKKETDLERLKTFAKAQQCVSVATSAIAVASAKITENSMSEKATNLVDEWMRCIYNAISFTDEKFPSVDDYIRLIGLLPIVFSPASVYDNTKGKLVLTGLLYPPDHTALQGALSQLLKRCANVPFASFDHMLSNESPVDALIYHLLTMASRTCLPNFDDVFLSWELDDKKLNHGALAAMLKNTSVAAIVKGYRECTLAQEVRRRALMRVLIYRWSEIGKAVFWRNQVLMCGDEKFVCMAIGSDEKEECMKQSGEDAKHAGAFFLSSSHISETGGSSSADLELDDQRNKLKK